MSTAPPSGKTVADAVAERVELRRGETSQWAVALRELGAVDRAAYEAVARTATRTLDRPVRRLSQAANHSRLWICIAAAIAAVGGRPGRAAALEGILATGVTSATVNLAAKSIASRPRPARVAEPYEEREVSMPGSRSFPSGHSASAFAFAYSVGRHVPLLAVPIRFLAGAVAYSRVHVGVHYPGDVAAGAIVGAGIASMVAAVLDRRVGG